MTWNGAGAWLIVSQSRQVNFSRTCWITFHWRGITSSVSVTSSPSLRQPRAAAAEAGGRPGHDHPLARQMLGNGWRAGRLRVNAATVVVLRGPGAAFGRQFVLGGRGFEFLQLQLDLVEQPGGALGTLAVAIALELLDLQLQMRDQGLVVGGPGLGNAHPSPRRSGCPLGKQRRFQRLDIVWQRVEAVTHASDEITKAAIWRCFFVISRDFSAAYPALCGRQVCCGFRQSIASSK